LKFSGLTDQGVGNRNKVGDIDSRLNQLAVGIHIEIHQ